MKTHPNYLFNKEANLPMPDPFVFSGKARPKPNHVISYFSNLNVASRYYQDEWDMTLYSTTKQRHIIFTSIPLDHRDDIKWLIFTFLYHHRGRNNNSPAVSTLANINRTLFKISCSLKKGETIISFFNDEKRMAQYLHKQKLSFFKSFQQFYTFITSLDEKTLGFKIKAFSKLKQLVSLRNIQYSRECNQTAVIPPRIYKKIHELLWEEAAELDKNISSIEAALSEYQILKVNADNDSLTGTKRNNYLKEKMEPLLKELSCFYPGYNMKNLFGLIGKLRMACVYLICFYSGMRAHEVNNLMLDCLSKSDNDKTGTTRLIGFTSKYAGTDKRAIWVTIKDIEPVIDNLARLAKAIAYRVVGTPDEKKIPLLISIYYYNHKYQFTDELLVFNTINLDKRILTLNNIEIKEEDMNFLELIEPFRDWQLELPFQLGQNWMFSIHQFRRSLAVYAAQSGLVSIGAMQFQLKHLLNTVTLYYSNGAEYAKQNCDESSLDFSQEYNDNELIADVTAYFSDIVLTDDLLLGAGGKVIEKLKKEMGDSNAQIHVKRLETLSDMKNGVAFYRETPLGGCSQIGECDSYLTGKLDSCLTCTGATIKAEKLQRVVNVLTRRLSTYAQESIEYKTSLKEVSKLRALLNKATRLV